MGVTMDKLKDMVDADTVIGNPISTPNGTTIIPISKISYGFASGGSDLPKKTADNELFAGGSGAGVSVQPLGFLIVYPNGTAEVKEMTMNASKESVIINKLPEMIDKVMDIIKKDDKDGSKKEKSKTKKVDLNSKTIEEPQDTND